MKGSLNHPKKVTKNCQVCIFWCWNRTKVYIRCGPLPVTVTTRIITFFVGESYTPLFATVTGRGPHPRYIYIYSMQVKLIYPFGVSKIPIIIYHSYCCWLESCTRWNMLENPVPPIINLINVWVKCCPGKPTPTGFVAGSM